ncbi:MAG: caspase domain-containing protein, partial [Cyanobium sp.]
MPATAASPNHTHALIVGIERYAAGQQWDLDGPLNDALQIRDWLLSSGVPAEQIHLHVSALEKNRAALDDRSIWYQQPTDQALRETIERIKYKPFEQDDLLFVYWAGHGLITVDQQCLLLAEATDKDKKSFGVETIRLSFANENCPGFRHQIFLFDTCRSFDRQPTSPPPVVPLPSGQRLQKSQFLFFASQEGQPAINSSQERCGLFTKTLLQQLDSSQATPHCWPPDMDSLATAVQQIFKENQQQYPVFTRYRDFQGNDRIDPLPLASEAESSVAAEPVDLLCAVNQLATLLAEHLGPPNKREDILRAFRYCSPLGPEIVMRVERRSNAFDDYKSLIDSCLERPGGFDLLMRTT